MYHVGRNAYKKAKSLENLTSQTLAYDFRDTELFIREEGDDVTGPSESQRLLSTPNQSPADRKPPVSIIARPKGKPRRNSFDSIGQKLIDARGTWNLPPKFVKPDLAHPRMFVQTRDGHKQNSISSADDSTPKDSPKKASFNIAGDTGPDSVKGNVTHNKNNEARHVVPSDEVSLYPNVYERVGSNESDSVFSLEDDSRQTGQEKHGPCSIEASLRNGLFVILSGLYGIVIVVLGAVLPIAEIFEGPEQTYYIEGYYLFLYIVSIAFMIYVYMYLLRSHEADDRPRRVFPWMVRSGSQASAVAEPSRSRRRTRRISIDIRKNKQTGSFYLRLGAVGFGIGSMIHSGLQFGEYFQMYDGPGVCSGVLQALKPITHLLFTFVQLYFIFLNAKMCINKFQTVARFGLMHMIGTNMCVWFRNIVVETLHEIHKHEVVHHVTTTPTYTTPVPSVEPSTVTIDISHKIHRRSSDSQVGDHHGDIKNASVTYPVAYATNGETTYHLPEISCHFNDVMGRVVEQAGPYLYPCTIEYSLICAGILYVMWRNVGRDHSRHLPPAVDGELGLYRHRMSVDCSNSHRGLFTGIFLFVCAVISIIAFFVLVQKEGMAQTAVTFVNLCEIITYTLAMGATIVAFHRMKSLSYVTRGGNLEDNLVIISLCGVFIFAIFSIIAATDDSEANGGVLIVFADILLMLQSTLQTVFMLSGMRMYATRDLHVREKPGREMVTFLLVTNIAMWGMTTFETQRAEHNPVQLHFYGYLSWSILTHISVPLAIFFRFHSTVCLSNIWKQAWKKRANLL